jgi:hypothetical protein
MPTFWHSGILVAGAYPKSPKIKKTQEKEKLG